MKVMCLLDVLPLLQGNSEWVKGTTRFSINGHNRPNVVLPLLQGNSEWVKRTCVSIDGYNRPDVVVLS